MMILFALAVAAAPSAAESMPRPVQPLARLVSPWDYPANALAARQQGQVLMALSVNDTGRIDGCRITKSSGSAWLDRASCLIMHRRARFHPAVSADGKRVAGSFDHMIEWMLPQ